MVNSVTQLGKAIQSVLQVHANRAGVSTGLIKRVREFTGATFAQTMILGQMQEGEIAMSDLASFARQVGVNVSAQAMISVLNKKTATFFSRTAQCRALRRWWQRISGNPLLERFSEVIVEDSTTQSLPDELEEVWQGCGNATESAKSAFKVHVRMDLLSGGLKGQALTDGRVPDTKSPLRLNRRQRRSIRIVDLGYFDTHQFQKEGEAEEYWISRLKVGGSLQIFDEAGHPLDLCELLCTYAGRTSLRMHYSGKCDNTAPCPLDRLSRGRKRLRLSGGRVMSAKHRSIAANQVKRSLIVWLDIGYHQHSC